MTTCITATPILVHHHQTVALLSRHTDVQSLVNVGQCWLIPVIFLMHTVLHL